MSTTPNNNEPSLKEKTAKGIFWGGVGSGLRQICTLVFGIFLARILNDNDYGLVGALAIFGMIASCIIDSGFLIALTNKKDATDEDYNAVFWFNTLTGIAIYILFYFCAPVIAGFYDKPHLKQELIDVSRVIFICFILNGTGCASYAYLFKNLMTKQLAVIDGISFPISLSVSVILALKGYAYWALVAQQIILAFLQMLLRIMYSKWKPSFKFNFQPLKSMFPFGVKLLFTNIFIQINNNIFSVLLGKFFTINQVGQYSQGQKWGLIGNQFIAETLNKVTQPVLVQANDNDKRQVNILRKLLRFNAFISFPLMLGLAFIGREFTVITVGEKWLPSVPFLQLFCIWYAFTFLFNTYVNLVWTKGKSNLYMYGTVISGVAQLLSIVVTFRWGIMTMVATYISMYFVSLLLWHYYVHKLTGLRLRDVLKDIMPYLGITLVCFAVAWALTKNIENIYMLASAKILISSALYLLMLQLFKSVIFKECREFFSGKIL